ncbi:MAG TPA: carbohydrate ABC transporter permease, partial [Fibrobacteria bacterium]|nr:carbohydrate ABC transporter permease [Fibrobacteria bacterium]
TRDRAVTLLATAILMVLAVAYAYPFLWMFFAGFKADAAIFNPFPLLPERYDLTHYRSLLSGEWIPYPVQFLNSLFIASVQTALATACSCAAGYVFAKFAFPMRRLLFILAVLTVLIPRQVMALPLFTWMNDLHLLDTPWAVILPGTATGIGLLWFTAIYHRLPDTLPDMARAEGAGEYRVFLMTLPLIRPAILAFALIQFTLCWQEHLIPLVMLFTRGEMTVNLGLASLHAGSLRTPYAMLMAGCTLTLIPTTLFFALAYRHFRTALGSLTES